ncbi:MAG: hypothetical protein IJF57_03795 [Clostridia bacterium]|nr:hypothetical protein [Clostridia bacterium]
MNYIKSCEFNIDTACVEVKLIDGSMVSIDCIAVENEYANNMYETSELDHLNFVCTKTQSLRCSSSSPKNFLNFSGAPYEVSLRFLKNARNGVPLISSDKSSLALRCS